MAGGRSFSGGGFEAEVGGQIVGAPLAVDLGAGEDAGAGCVKYRAIDAAPAVFHAGLKRTCHLTTALLAEGLIFGLFAVGGLRRGHDRKIAEDASSATRSYA